MSSFKEMFEVDEQTGAYLYRTDACCNRHKNMSRNDMREKRTWNFNGAYWSEENLLNDAYRLKDMGYKIEKGESLEEYVARYGDVLD